MIIIVVDPLTFMITVYLIRKLLFLHCCINSLYWK